MSRERKNEINTTRRKTSAEMKRKKYASQLRRGCLEPFVRHALCTFELHRTYIVGDLCLLEQNEEDKACSVRVQRHMKIVPEKETGLRLRARVFVKR